MLDRFAIDFSLCMYCGICIEVCPFDALHWSPEFEYAETDIRDLLHEKERLGQWMQTVPPPPALDPRPPSRPRWPRRTVRRARREDCASAPRRVPPARRRPPSRQAEPGEAPASPSPEAES